jgi:hypothetical protein
MKKAQRQEPRADARAERRREAADRAPKANDESALFSREGGEHDRQRGG